MNAPSRALGPSLIILGAVLIGLAVLILSMD